jgi:cell division protein FtsI (penicillin-binding protein 3)
VIRNKEFAKEYYGAKIAGPVFKEIAEKLVARNIKTQPYYVATQVNDSSILFGKGWKPDFLQIYNTLKINVKESNTKNNWNNFQSNGHEATSTTLPLSLHTMPDVKGMGLKDAIFLLENLSLHIQVQGTGKIQAQSLVAGTTIKKGQTVNLSLY